MVFFFTEEVIECDVACNKERNDHESETHFEENVENGMEADGNDKTFGEFLLLEKGFFAKAKDFVKGDGPMVAVFFDFLLEDWLSKVGNAVIVAKDAREK